MNISVATVITKAPLAEQELMSSSSWSIRLTLATDRLLVSQDYSGLGFWVNLHGSAAEPVTSSGGGIAVLL